MRRVHCSIKSRTASFWCGDGGVSVDQQVPPCVACDECQDAPLPPAALTYEVLLQQGFVAVVGNSVEVQVKGVAGVAEQPLGHRVPRVHERDQVRLVHARAVFAERGLFGQGVESGKEGAALIEDVGHDPVGASDAPELERQQGAEHRAGGHLPAGRPAGQVRLQPGPGQIPGKQEQAAELRGPAAGGDLELAHVGPGCGARPGPGHAARQLGKPGLLEHGADRGRARRQVFRFQPPGDLHIGEALPAQLNDAGIAPVAGGPGRRNRHGKRAHLRVLRSSAPDCAG